MKEEQHSVEICISGRGGFFRRIIGLNQILHTAGGGLGMKLGSGIKRITLMTVVCVLNVGKKDDLVVESSPLKAVVSLSILNSHA